MTTIYKVKYFSIYNDEFRGTTIGIFSDKDEVEKGIEKFKTKYFEFYASRIRNEFDQRNFDTMKERIVFRTLEVKLNEIPMEDVLGRVLPRPSEYNSDWWQN